MLPTGTVRVVRKKGILEKGKYALEPALYTQIDYGFVILIFKIQGLRTIT